MGQVRKGLEVKEAVAVRRMFGRIARRYDLLNRLLSLGLDRSWRRRVVRRAAAARPSLALDVCTGTGDLALGLPAECLVAGADFSLEMLALARRKASRNRRGVVFFAGDALRLPLRARSVDLVTVAFGVRNFERLADGLGELARVLRPGGRLLVLELSHPRGRLAPLLGWWARRVPPRLGGWLAGDAEAYTYLPLSVERFASSATMCRRLEACGFEEVAARAMTAGVVTLYEATRRAGGGEEARSG